MTVKILGHPVHQQLIVFPVGLLATGFLFDAIDLLGGSAIFGVVGFYNIAAGLISVVIAAAFGLLDWSTIPSGTRAKKLGMFHAITNTIVAVLFLISLLARIGGEDRQPTWGLFLLELVGAVLLGASGWMGGELVDRHGVGVHPGANVDAPSSLSGRPASEGSGSRT
ncbi:MAG TPA: DUF2231 domain-containing protein [Micromonosporaceae bacterium]|nr:DUF2231 domain-containing protein [Micromonosporaceae bacterium]